jgi:hypothetical protein
MALWSIELKLDHFHVVADSRSSCMPPLIDRLTVSPRVRAGIVPLSVSKRHDW